ncbi:MAG: hypothetical protein ACM32F_05770 [Betaproteobacteria bacterium]
MARAEREQRALRRELLLARAAAERVMLADQLETLETRSRTGIAGLLIGGARRAGSSGWLGTARSVVRLARAQPWMVPVVVSGVARLARSRTLRWLVVAGTVAAVVWWIRKGDAPKLPATEGETTATLPDLGEL